MMDKVETTDHRCNEEGLLVIARRGERPGFTDIHDILREEFVRI